MGSYSIGEALNHLLEKSRWKPKVTELRMKQDLVPGMEIPIHFTATRTGRYELACAELCGLGHYKMRAFVEVMSDQDYQKWMQNMTAAQ